MQCLIQLFRDIYYYYSVLQEYLVKGRGSNVKFISTSSPRNRCYSLAYYGAPKVAIGLLNSKASYESYG